MKYTFLPVVLNIVIGLHSVHAASASSTASDTQEPCFVGNVQILPFFDSIPVLAEPTKYFRPFSGTYETDFETFKIHLRDYRTGARFSMEDGIIPVHELIRRLARRNITITVTNPENSLELIQDSSRYCDARSNSVLWGLSIKDSLYNIPETKRITAEQCYEFLGTDCINYLKEVKTLHTPLWQAIHGRNAQTKLGYYGELDTKTLRTSRKFRSARMFVKANLDTHDHNTESRDIVASHAEVRARQCAALLSIMNVCGEAVVRECKKHIVTEWLEIYCKESPCSWVGSSSKDYPSMPMLAYSIPSDCTVS